MAKKCKHPGAKDALLTVSDYRKAARRRLSKAAFDYYRSGAETESTLARNRSAFADYEIWYRVLADVSERNMATEILETKVSMPILIAPTAYHLMAHSEGEAGTARAAADARTLMVVSTLATTALEEVAAASDGPKWFQLYVHRDRGFSEELVARACASGYCALVLTVDTPILGRRLRDERNGFALPNGLAMANLATAAEENKQDGSMLANYVGARHDATLTWKDLEWLRSKSTVPLLLKGVARADDARRALDCGVDGIIVSNHGARQLDGAPASLDALGPIAKAVGGRCPVLMDGGIEDGSDVLKALGLGASAILLGRPILWGLAVGGSAGVRHVLEMFRDSLDRAMALAGINSLSDLPPDLIRKRGQ